MSGTGSDGGSALDYLKGLGGSSGQGASQFTTSGTPGAAASQFTMPGGQIPNYQGASMMPATLGGVQGVADAQDYTNMVQQAGGMTDANWQQLAQAAAGAGGKLEAPGNDTRPAPAGARPGGGGAQQNFVPPQLLQYLAGTPQQGTMNLAGSATGGAQAPVQSLMQLLQLGNKGFAVK